MPPKDAGPPDCFNYEDPAYLKVKDLTLHQPEPDAETIAKTKGVPQSVYLTYIKGELEDESNCLQLPMTILLLVSFSYLAMAHLGQNKVYALEESIEFDISENANFAFAHAFGHKGLEDVNSVADFWSWMRLGFLPLVYQPSWSYSEGYPAALGESVLKGTNYSQDDLPSTWMFPGYQKPAPVQNDYMRYHKIIGGIRMIQHIEPATTDNCRDAGALDDGGRLLATGAAGRFSVGRKSGGRQASKPCSPQGLAELPPELDETETFSDLTRKQWLLPEYGSLDELKNVLLDMEDGCTFAAATKQPDSCACDWCKKQTPRQPWLDEETMRVEVSFVVFNPTYGVYTYVGVNLFFNRGGHIHKFINSMSAWADPNASPVAEQVPTWIADILWVSALLYVIVLESKEVFNLIRNSRERWWRALWNDYIEMWNVIDWVSILVALIIIQYYISMRLAIGTVNVQLKEMIQRSLDKPDQAAYEAGIDTFFVTVQDMCSVEKEFRRMLCVYPMIVMMRLFKSFKAQPRLALVTDTMTKAASDLFHFGIVFFSVFVCMIVNSVLFFGQDVQEFGSVARAVHSCFRAMFGDWDWDNMKEIGFIKAQIWFLLFQFIMVLILLNMLLAIVMDAYAAVKEKAGSAQRLDEQIMTMKRRWRESRQGKRMRLNKVYDVFLKEANGDEKAMLADQTLLKPDDVARRLPLPMKQATRTLANAYQQQKSKEDAANQVDEETLNDQIKELLQKVEKRTDVIQEDAEIIKDRLSYWDRFQVPGDPEYDFHFGGEGGAGDVIEDIDLTTVVDTVSEDIGSMFVKNMSRIENMQDSLQEQQDELHQLISEMQIMVDQQVRCVASISEDMTSIGSPRRLTEDEPEAPP